ncbi:uncharacterized protein UDID_17222 [Ustilago sp. UG-2017a]|nr:uncharacterized protein UDID_17222 [Ustilago sp. UG-2017a]
MSDGPPPGTIRLVWFLLPMLDADHPEFHWPTRRRSTSLYFLPRCTSPLCPAHRAPAPPCSRSDSSSSQDICSRSRSPPISQAPLPSSPTGQPPALASVSSVVPLEQQVEQQFCHLEQRLNGQFSKLLASIRASQAPAVAAPPALNLSSDFPPPRPHPHPAGFDLAALQPVAPAGESQPLSVSRSFPWVPVEVVLLVKCDQLKPEHLVKLCNPESHVSQEASRSTGLTLTDRQLSIVNDSSDSRTSAFVKAILSIATLAQVWLVYVAICACHTANLELNTALLAHLEQLLEFDHLYSWHAMTDYHLAVCRQCFGTAAISEWVSYDPQVAGRVLFPYQKSSHNSSRQDPNLGSSSGQPPPMHPPALANTQSQALPASSSRRADDSTLATHVLVAVALTSASTARVLTLCCPAPLSPRPPTWWPRRQPDGEYFSSLRRIVTPASTTVKHVSPAVLDTLNVVHRACTAFECAAASIAIKHAFPGVSDTLNVATMACTASKCAAASTAVECAHGDGDTCNIFPPVRHTFNVQHPADTTVKCASSCCLSWA